MQTPDGLELSPPPGFELEETSLAFRAKAQDLKDPRILQAQRPAVQPNLIVRRKPLATGTSLEQYAGEMCGELVKTVGGIDALESSAFKFADGAAGLIIAYELTASEAVTLQQYHALRLDGAIVTVLTLTADRLSLTDDTRQKYLAALASASLWVPGKQACPPTDGDPNPSSLSKEHA